jgi:hypothetical protein
MPSGTLIDIRFANGSKARSYLTHVDADGFSYRIADSRTGGEVEQRSTSPVGWIAPRHFGCGEATGVVKFCFSKHALRHSGQFL